MSRTTRRLALVAVTAATFVAAALPATAATARSAPTSILPLAPATTVIHASAETTSYGGIAKVTGWVTGPNKTVTVHVHDADTGADLFDVVATLDVPSSESRFTFSILNVIEPRAFRLDVDAGADYLAAETTVSMPVRGHVHLTANHHYITFGHTVRFTAKVWPAASGHVKFQWWNANYDRVDGGHGAWRPIADNVDLAQLASPPASGEPYSYAKLTWRPKHHKTYKIRAWFMGGAFGSGVCTRVDGYWSHVWKVHVH